MDKKDYKKELKEFYNPSTKEVSEVVVPRMNFLMIDGKGDPNTSKEFADAISLLYPIAYTIKFAIKKSTGFDFGVMPLEGLWWADDMSDFVSGKKDNWYWTLMIMQPEIVKAELVESAKLKVESDKGLDVSKLRFEAYNEGLSAQLMHIGPFSAERPNIQKLHQYVADKGGKLSGKHHEIYLSDMRKTAPEKLKTVIRQPFEL